MSLEDRIEVINNLQEVNLHPGGTSFIDKVTGLPVIDINKGSEPLRVRGRLRVDSVLDIFGDVNIAGRVVQRGFELPQGPGLVGQVVKVMAPGVLGLGTDETGGGPGGSSYKDRAKNDGPVLAQGDTAFFPGLTKIFTVPSTKEYDYVVGFTWESSKNNAEARIRLKVDGQVQWLIEPYAERKNNPDPKVKAYSLPLTAGTHTFQIEVATAAGNTAVTVTDIYIRLEE